MTATWGGAGRVGPRGLFFSLLAIMGLAALCGWYYAVRLPASARNLTRGDVEISFWYGPSQSFGVPGRAQRWINVLGDVQPASEVRAAWYTLDHGPSKPLSLGSDLHRLAEPGDFNVDLSWDEIVPGEHTVSVGVQLRNGVTATSAVSISVQEAGPWPLPLAIDFSSVANVPGAVQVVDGRWAPVEDGVRILEPFYDRVLCLGDTTWRDYGSETLVTIHDFTPPVPGPPTYQVTHFGIAMRWNGHHEDDVQPHRKWYPLGGQGEFLVRSSPDSSQWRILFDQSDEKPQVLSQGLKARDLGSRIRIRTEVETLVDGRTRYRFKKWSEEEEEPPEWDVEAFEIDDDPAGSLCLVAHNTDVTIHRVEAWPLPGRMKE